MSDRNHKENFNSNQGINKNENQYKRHYTHHELLNNIAHYKSFIHSKDDRNSLNKIKEAYLKREGSKHIVRANRDDFFLLSKRTGISPDKDLFEVRAGDHYLDKSHRQKIQTQAKNLYRRNFDFVRKFKHKAKGIEKLNAKDKAITKPIKAPLRIPRIIHKEQSKIHCRKHFQLVKRFSYSLGVKPELRPKTTKLYHKNYELTKRFNMTRKDKSIGMEKEI